MSSIPNSAMPHAAPTGENENEAGDTATLAQRVKDQAGRVATLARDNPKTALAAGAVLAAGVAAAAAIPLVKGRRAQSNGAAKSSGKSPSRTKTKAS